MEVRVQLVGLVPSFHHVGPEDLELRLSGLVVGCFSEPLCQPGAEMLNEKIT